MKSRRILCPLNIQANSMDQDQVHIESRAYYNKPIRGYSRKMLSQNLKPCELWYPSHALFRLRLIQFVTVSETSSYYTSLSSLIEDYGIVVPFLEPCNCKL